MTSLRTKLTVLLTAPLLVLVVVAVSGVESATGAKSQTDQSAKRLQLATAAGDAALALIQERRMTASPSHGGDLDTQREQTDDAAAALLTQIDRLDPEGYADVGAQGVVDALERVPEVRSSVGEDTSPDDVLRHFSQTLEPVLALDASFDDPSDPEIFTRFQAQRAIVRAIERASAEESLLLPILADGALTQEDHNRLTGVITSQAMWLQQFLESADPGQIDAYRQMNATQSVTSAERVRDRVLAGGPSDAVDEDAIVWATAMDKKVDLMMSLASEGATNLEGALDQRRADTGRSLFIAYGYLLAAIGGLVLLVAGVRRFAIRPLTALAADTRRAAAEVSPAVEAGEPETLSPLELPADSELSDIADAYNTVQGAVVTMAEEQVATREDIHEVFINFGRRAQNLVTQQLGQIDSLEARTEDPDTLADLFILDHLATRLRRNTEGMAVLAGAESPRPWARPVSVANVIRAAVAETTDYSRVDVAQVAPAAVTGATANDVSHLLAEFIDNALTYSPPESRITLAGERYADDHYLITVSDAGLGMTAAQLAEANTRLSATASDRTVPLSKHFGLHVAGRLAQRHDIALRLVPSALNGITAEVLLPPDLVALPGDDAVPGLKDPSGETPASPPSKQVRHQVPPLPTMPLNGSDAVPHDRSSL